MLAFSLLAYTPSLWAADITANVDRNTIDFNETIKLSVRVSPQTKSTPDFSQLESQFDILGQSQNSQYRNINGNIEAFTEWQLVLAPKMAGKLVIPSFQYEGDFSDAIILQVNKASENEVGIAPDIYMEITTDKANPYVQEQVIISLKLFTAVPLRVEDAPPLNIPNTLLLPLKDTQYQRRVNDKIYSVSELKYALFPQLSGNLEIPIQTFTVTTQSNKNWRSSQPYSATQTRRVRSQPISLAVRPQPDQFNGSHWLPANSLELTEQWSQQDNQWTVGEPVTRNISLRAKGLSANQLPALPLPDSSAVKQYREQPESQDNADANGVNTIKTESIAMVPTQIGSIELPEVVLYWWDTQSDQQKKAILPARTIEVVANPNMPASAPPSNAAIETHTQQAEAVLASAPDMRSHFWIWVSALLFLSNVVTLYYLYRKPPTVTLMKKKEIKVSDVGALTQLTTGSITTQKAKELLIWLDKWSQAAGTDTLENRLRRVGLTTLAEQAEHLNAFAYGGRNHYDGNITTILSAVKDAEKTGAFYPEKPVKSNLAPLYPQ